MGFYIGTEDKQIYLNGKFYYLTLGLQPKTIDGVAIITSDNYIVTDANNLYMTLEDGE